MKKKLFLFILRLFLTLLDFVKSAFPRRSLSLGIFLLTNEKKIGRTKKFGRTKKHFLDVRPKFFERQNTKEVF